MAGFVLAWSITEVIRYSFYAFSLLDSLPYVLQWCRFVNLYTLTLILIFSNCSHYFSSGADKENLFDNQELFRFVIISFILMTYALDYK